MKKHLFRRDGFSLHLPFPVFFARSLLVASLTVLILAATATATAALARDMSGDMFENSEILQTNRPPVPSDKPPAADMFTGLAVPQSIDQDVVERQEKAYPAYLPQEAVRLHRVPTPYGKLFDKPE
jgi:hypothetical protein